MSKYNCLCGCQLMPSSLSKHRKTAKHFKLIEKMKYDSKFSDVFNCDKNSIKNEITQLCQDDLINALIEDKILLQRWVEDYVSKLSKEDCLLVLEESNYKYYFERSYRSELEYEIISYIQTIFPPDEEY